MERFIPVEIFRKKSNAFRGITFFPFLLKRSKFVVLIIRNYVPSLERSRITLTLRQTANVRFKLQIFSKQEMSR